MTVPSHIIKIYLAGILWAGLVLIADIEVRNESGSLHRLRKGLYRTGGPVAWEANQALHDPSLGFQRSFHQLQKQSPCQVAQQLLQTNMVFC